MRCLYIKCYKSRHSYIHLYVINLLITEANNTAKTEVQYSYQIATGSYQIQFWSGNLLYEYHTSVFAVYTPGTCANNCFKQVQNYRNFNIFCVDP